MPALIEVPPNSANYPVTPAQYQTLLSELKANSHTSNLTVTGNGGGATYQNVSFEWTYDGTATLQITITHKGGMTRFIPNDTIFSEINDQLLKGT